MRDHHANLPEGTTTIFGQKVDHQTFRGNMTSPRDITLSGGQSQKIAVARTIMRATSGHERVGILLFDEPSASMDPVVRLRLFTLPVRVALIQSPGRILYVVVLRRTSCA